MSQALVADLKAKYPVFHLKNKHNVAKSLFLSNGEEIVAPPNGLVKVKSSQINSFPDFATFHYITPSMSVLDEYEVLNRKTAKSNAKLHKDDEANSTKTVESPTPLNEHNSPAVDGKAAGNNTVKSPTSSTIDSSANLASKAGSVTDKPTK